MQDRRPKEIPPAEQRPGAVVANAKSLDRFIGNVIRELRLKDNLTIAEVAAQAGISRGMVSKIENGLVSTSLETLSKIVQALGVSLAHLFRHYDMPSGGAQLVRNRAGMEVVRRGTRRGHTYHLLAYDQGPRKVFEPFLITMDDASEVFPTFEHPGTEFIYMLHGRIEYRHGQQTYSLEPGDSLTFRGDIPHGPERLIELPIHFLSIIIYGGQADD
ncbi:MAG: helix-turn-helix transcriptional regulator [Prolixibacteraceae bacterium]|nr:helix-turn-helix transcriptional regulator [Burkholderiales bacterium]